MSTIPAMYNRGPDNQITGVTFYVGFKPYQSDVSHAGFPQLLEELRKPEPDTDRLILLTQPIEAIRTAFEDAVAADYLPAGVVSVSRSQITYNGQVITGVLVDRILTMLSEGFDIMPMVRFLENLYLNPSGAWTHDEIYLWLEGNNLPITQDGHFLAYKNVKRDFTSHHDEVTDNTPGVIVSMPREQVDKVRAHECSTGLHFCSRGYLSNYTGTHMTDNVVVMLKINPADVVAIPSGDHNTKGRAWKYLVLHAIEMEDAQSKAWPAVVTANGTEFTEQEPTAATEFGSDDELAEQADDAATWLDDGQASTDLGETTEVTAVQDDAGWVRLGDEAIDAEVTPLFAPPVTEEVYRDPFAEPLRQQQVAHIESMGIIALRSAASKAGMKNAWRGSNKEGLRAFLISKLDDQVS